MKHQKPFFEKWKPAVPARILVLAAGCVWFGAGILLNSLAGTWLGAESPATALAVACSGAFCALLIHHWGFLRLVNKNLRRILPMDEPRCFFSFIPWKNYLLVFCMVFMGHIIRHSPLPKPVLAALYIAIGTALLLSSIRYFRFFLKMSIQAQ